MFRECDRSRTRIMKIGHILLLSIAAYEVACASEANLLADQALEKLSTWINSEGSVWFTLPGYYKKGQSQSHNGEVTLALAGPELGKIGAIARSGEAQLEDGDPDSSYDTSQTLRFVASFLNITVDYNHVSYNEANYGFFNLTSQVTTDGVSVEIAINLKGHGDSCMAFANSMHVSFNGSLWVTVAGPTANREMTPIFEAVKTHFKNNVPKAVGTLLKTATFDSLEYYDICTGVYYPQSPPNVLADSVLNVTSHALATNISAWATLPGFSKTAVVNDTNLDVIKVGKGKFSSFGQIKRIGVASYENLVDPKLMNLTSSFETSNLTAAYGNIEYNDYSVSFPLAELVTAPKIRTTLTITFTRKTPNSVPSCVGGSVTVKSKYLPSGGDLRFENLTPAVPQYAIRSVNEVLGPGFIDTVEEAASDLFQNAAMYALTEFCS